jgi:hypothetical protein
MDLVEAFHDAGAVTSVINFRADSLAERWSQLRDGRRLLFNPATCRRLSKRLSGFSPDLVIVLNYPGLPAAAAEAMRAAMRPGVPVIGWLCDQLDVFPPGYAPLLDGVYYFDSACLPVLEKHYLGTGARLAFLPLAACPKRYACPDLDVRTRKPCLVFAGNCTPSRQSFFTEYRNLGQKLDLYGPHGGNWPEIWRNRKLSSAALARVYREYMINLNLLQPGNTSNGLNLRAFEIPCAGGLATYPDVPDLTRCFMPNEEVLVYKSAPDLAEIVGKILDKPRRSRRPDTAGCSGSTRFTIALSGCFMIGSARHSNPTSRIPSFLQNDKSAPICSHIPPRRRSAGDQSRSPSGASGAI